MDAIRTLQQAVQYFSNYENCKRVMVQLRWPDGVVKCPQCGSDHVTCLEKARVWKCYGKHDRPKFSLKTGTIFEDSPLGLDKWLPAGRVRRPRASSSSKPATLRPWLRGPTPERRIPSRSVAKKWTTP